MTATIDAVAPKWTAVEQELVDWFLHFYDVLKDNVDERQHQIDMAGLYTLINRGPGQDGHGTLMRHLAEFKADALQFHAKRKAEHLYALANWNPKFFTGPRRSGVR